MSGAGFWETWALTGLLGSPAPLEACTCEILSDAKLKLTSVYLTRTEGGGGLEGGGCDCGCGGRKLSEKGSGKRVTLSHCRHKQGKKLCAPPNLSLVVL